MEDLGIDGSRYEVTLEANPKELSTKPGLLQEFKEAGVTRISLGIQVI